MRNYKKERENYHSRPEQMVRNAARKRARRQMEREGKAKSGDGKDVHHKDNDPLNNDKNNLSLVTQHYNRKEPRLRKEDAISRAKERAALKKKHAAEKEAEKIAVKRASEEIEEGKKTFRQTDNVGKAKYTISYHDGKKKHKDGSDFFDMKIFKNKSSLEKFKKDLKRKGYREEEDTQEANAVSMSNPDAKVMIGMMQQYVNTKNPNLKMALLKKINKLQSKLGLKVTEDMGTVTGPHIAGTGDDSDTVIVKKKKKVYKRQALKNSIKALAGARGR